MLDGLIKLVVGALAVWRISVFLWYENGPFDQAKYFRKWVSQNAKPMMVQGDDGEPIFIEHVFWKEFNNQLKCFWCVTFWVSLPVAVIVMLPWYWWTVLVPFALSAAAMLLSGVGRTIWRVSNEPRESKEDD